MFCPKCSMYLEETDLIKLNIVYAPGNIPVEYDAQCPNCRVNMGRVFWGKLAANPDLTQRTVVTPKEAGDAPRPEEPPRKAGGQESPKAKLCPHCGLPLPADF